MSKFFNETQQKPSEWAQKPASEHDLNIKEILENLRGGANSGGMEVAKVRLSQCQTVQLGDRNGAPLITSNDASAQAAGEAYRNLRTRLMRYQAKSGIRSIAITSALAGEGKTLTAMNLGLCYSQVTEQRVLVIDADLRTRGLTHLLGGPATAGLAEVLAGQVTPDQAVLATDQKNLFAMAAGSVLSSPPELFSGPRWQELLGWCSETFKTVLVDTPPVLPLSDFELISAACEGIVAVVRAHHGQREVLKKASDVLDPKKLLGVVFNSAEIGPRSEYDYGYGYR